MTVVVDRSILRRVRSEYGKSIRRGYEKHIVKATWGEIKQYEPRTDGISNCLTGVSKDNLLLEHSSDGTEQIRFLTEREALRLMGQKDDAIDRVFDVELSKAVRYRFASNSIVVDVLEAIFKGIYVDKTFRTKSRTLEDFL